MTTVTLEMMQNYLNRFGWNKYKAAREPFEKEGIIFTGWRSPKHDRNYVLTIDPMVECGCLSFRVPQVLAAPSPTVSSERIADLGLAIAYINFRILVGKFAYDPRDGEVRFSVDVPIEESTFTYEQFVHCIGAAVQTVENYAQALRAVAEGQQTARQFIAIDSADTRELRKSFAEFLRGLLKAIEDEPDSLSGGGGMDRRRGGNGNGNLE